MSDTQENPPAPAQSVVPAVPIGGKFPDGALLTATGSPTTLAATRGEAPAVVVFYRGEWCPYCNLALAAYRTALSLRLRQRGIALIALSPQKPDGSLTMTEKHDLDFPVLSDPGNQIGGALGILFYPSEKTRQAYLDHGVDLTSVNADSTVGLPMPTVAIVSASGVLAWIDIHPDYSARTESADILSALETLDLS